MKKLIFILTLFYTSLLHAQWRSIYRDQDSTNNIIGASFFSPSTGYIATDRWIGFTSDSGRSFQYHADFLSGKIVSGSAQSDGPQAFTPHWVHAFNKDKILVAGSLSNYPSILYSSDQGKNWKEVYHGSIADSAESIANAVIKISFSQDGNTGFAIQGNEIVKTTDAGLSWHAVFQQKNAALFALSFATEQTGYAAAPDMLLRTTDGGDSWTIMSKTDFTVQGISVFGKQQLAVLGSKEDGYFLKSFSADGKSATSVHSFSKGPDPLLLNDIYFTNDSVGFVCGTGVYMTTNGGHDWKMMGGSESAANLGGHLGMYMLNSEQAWLMGPSGLLMKTQNQQRYLKLMPTSLSGACASGDITLHWTNAGTGPLDLFYRTNQSESYKKLAASISPGDSSYSFSLKKEMATGTVDFMIKDENSSLVDSVTTQMDLVGVPSVTIMRNKEAELLPGQYSFWAKTTNAEISHRFQWFVNGSATSMTDSVVSLSGLKNGDKVEAKMIVSGACTVATDAVSSNMLVIDGRDFDEINPQIKLYPNPANSWLNISGWKRDDQWTAIEIFDSRGEKRISVQNIGDKNSVTVQIGQLASGVYFARFINRMNVQKSISFIKL